ncbi:hypothetical protein MKK50_15760 [Methylobacterium sp. J-043]|jgi:hypothetical protein|uniref:Uncharacterized protein n=1 Tax=Methylobacterium goesingense TaxID=243690 RepID=A0ABV2LBD0_9HYPH|nr:MULTISPECIES: hypothetical protein [Methylobacteriaceae]MCJ2030828.1 hypothetical protein [Methylobacterium sp. J-043]KQP04895.1 hypothetical protein ASF28_18890 [Methylobacterium sp. Leaf99]KQT49077.1 hypothetical protein ASG52_08850 [Methylobacterium sp. Leaf456]UYW33830.1 hypothetical protein OKB92_07045 [Methylorubrum extorquens]GJD74516.1 hypothetical protein CFIICLFH_2750 [Methylobacterium goesingense]
MKLKSTARIRLSIILRFAWRVLVWPVLFVWTFEDRYLQRRPDPIPTSIEGIRANLARTDEALADIREIILTGRSKNGFALAQIWLKLQEQQQVLQAALATALAEEVRHTQPLAA